MGGFESGWTKWSASLKKWMDFKELPLKRRNTETKSVWERL